MCVSRDVKERCPNYLRELAAPVSILLLDGSVSPILNQHRVVVRITEALVRLLMQLLLGALMSFKRPRGLQIAFRPAVHIDVSHAALVHFGVSTVIIIPYILPHY